MPEITWLIDETSGDLLVEGLAPDLVPALVGDLLPSPVEMGCARPVTVHQLPVDRTTPRARHVRISGYYHDSLVEGPGRRSVVRFQGCPIHCPGCWVPETWDPDGGMLVDVESVANALLDPGHQRDGLTILGGEPFAQPWALADLLGALRSRQPLLHVVVYSGYTYEHLQRAATGCPAIAHVLKTINVLVDGPFIAKLADGAGSWTGSGNQKVIELRR